MTVLEDIKKEHAEKIKADESQPQETGSRLAKTIPLFIFLSPILFISFFMLHPPWSVVVVFLALLWFLIAFAIVRDVGALPKPISSGMELAIGIAATYAAIIASWGYLNAVLVQYGVATPAIVSLKDKPPVANSILVRTIDAGILLYYREQRMLNFFPWPQVVELEIPRRSWVFLGLSRPPQLPK